MKKILFAFILFLCMAGIVMAQKYLPVNVTPANATVQTSSILTVTFRPYLEDDLTAKCQFLTNITSNNAGYESTYSWSVTNNTKYSYTMRELPDSPTPLSYYFILNCSNSSDATLWNATDRYYFTIDSVNPSVRISSPSSMNYYNNNGSFYIRSIATDVNPAKCRLMGSVNLSNGGPTADSSIAELQNLTYTSNQTVQWNLSTANSRNISNGQYTFYVECNDTATNVGRSPNLSVTVTKSTLLSDSISCIAPNNNTRHTNRITFNWTGAGGTSFAYYNLTVVTGATTNNYLIRNNMTRGYAITAPSNVNVSWKVVPYDIAGNTNTAGNCSSGYFVTTTTAYGSNLNAGWNAFGWETELPVNLSDIATLSGATTVSTWNYTSNSFISYTGTNYGVTVKRGDPVWLYMNTSGTLEYEWSGNSTWATKQVTNASNIASVPVVTTNPNVTYLRAISDRINTTCGLMLVTTLVNQSSGRYTNFWCGYDENNITQVDWGSVVWLEWNQTNGAAFNFTG